MKNKKLIAYAIDFTSFLIEKFDINKIRKVILFGSVARNEASEESDIDLFVDVVGDERDSKKDINKLKEEFIKSKKFKDYWFLKGINNEIKIKIGKLDNWGDLKSSILSHGITLYGKYEELPKNAKNKVLFCWESIKPESKRVLLSKRLFGYKQDGKKYDGLAKKYGCEKIGKGILSVPSEHVNIFLGLFRNMKINVKIKKIAEYPK